MDLSHQSSRCYLVEYDVIPGWVYTPAIGLGAHLGIITAAQNTKKARNDRKYMLVQMQVKVQCSHGMCHFTDKPKSDVKRTTIFQVKMTL